MKINVFSVIHEDYRYNEIDSIICIDFEKEHDRDVYFQSQIAYYRGLRGLDGKQAFTQRIDDFDKNTICFDDRGGNWSSHLTKTERVINICSSINDDGTLNY